VADTSDRKLDWERLRLRFPSLPDLTYFNSGSYGLLADSVQAAFGEYLTSRLEHGAAWDVWVQRGEAVRAKVAALFGVSDDEIAVTASASAGINSIASALDFSGSRNRVVVSPYEFPTSGQIWLAQQARGAELVYIPEDDDRTVSRQAFEAAIDERTAIVVVSHVCYRHGAKVPDSTIRAIVDAAHQSGALVMIDCYQSAGAEPIRLKELGVDFAVGGMLKYLLGTAGIGFLYARQGVLEDLVPAATGWFAQADTNAMDMYHNVPSRSARRFQAGTPPVPSCYAADAGLDIILEVGIDRIAARIAELTGLAIAGLSEMGAQLMTPAAGDTRGPMLAIRARDEGALVEALKARKMVTSSRDGNLRAGFHFYNTPEEVENLLAALREHRDLLA